MTDVTITTCQPDELRELVGENPTNRYIPHVLCSPAWSAHAGDKLIGAGGIITQGLGEAWLALAPEALEHKKTLFATCKQTIEQQAKERRLWRLVAWCDKQTDAEKNFLDHLGFISMQRDFLVRLEDRWDL